MKDDELIAEFMGMRHRQEYGLEGNNQYTFVKQTPNANWQSCYWHKSWDWLMPVVQKIGKEGYFVQFQFDVMFTDPAACIIIKRKNIISIKGQDLIDVVYRAVVTHIKSVKNGIPNTEKH